MTDTKIFHPLLALIASTTDSELAKYLRETIHEFADHARKWCPWSGAYFCLQKSRGMEHHAALHKLATRWIRILFRVWKTRTVYDPAAYLAKIKHKNPAIAPFLTPTRVEA